MKIEMAETERPMGEIVDPTSALIDFGRALADGTIDPEPCVTDPQLLSYKDAPSGQTRFSFAYVSEGAVCALALFSEQGRIGRLPCFSVGYAVPEELRGQGRAKAVFKAAIAEVKAAFAAGGIAEFYVEAIIGVENAASLRVAEEVIGGEKLAITDENSGQPAIQFLKRIQTTAKSMKPAGRRRG